VAVGRRGRVQRLAEVLKLPLHCGRTLLDHDLGSRRVERSELVVALEPDRLTGGDHGGAFGRQAAEERRPRPRQVIAQHPCAVEPVLDVEQRRPQLAGLVQVEPADDRVVPPRHRTGLLLLLEQHRFEADEHEVQAHGLRCVDHPVRVLQRAGEELLAGIEGGGVVCGLGRRRIAPISGIRHARISPRATDRHSNVSSIGTG
jgi:hypothetical protein